MFIHFMSTMMAGSLGQHGAHLGPAGPRGLHVGLMNLAIWIFTSVTVITHLARMQPSLRLDLTGFKLLQWPLYQVYIPK